MRVHSELDCLASDELVDMSQDSRDGSQRFGKSIACVLGSKPQSRHPRARPLDCAVVALLAGQNPFPVSSVRNRLEPRMRSSLDGRTFSSSRLAARTLRL